MQLKIELLDNKAKFKSCVNNEGEILCYFTTFLLYRKEKSMKAFEERVKSILKKGRFEHGMDERIDKYLTKYSL